jgi:hypothetical protein
MIDIDIDTATSKTNIRSDIASPNPQDNPMSIPGPNTGNMPIDSQDNVLIIHKDLKNPNKPNLGYNPIFQVPGPDGRPRFKPGNPGKSLDPVPSKDEGLSNERLLKSCVKWSKKHHTDWCDALIELAFKRPQLMIALLARLLPIADRDDIPRIINIIENHTKSNPNPNPNTEDKDMDIETRDVATPMAMADAKTNAHVLVNNNNLLEGDIG